MKLAKYCDHKCDISCETLSSNFKHCNNEQYNHSSTDYVSSSDSESMSLEY